MSITNAMSPTDAPSFVEDWLPGFDGTNFYTRTWRASPGPARAALLYVHGFADHISRNEHFFARWAAAGVTVFAYDMRGFGKTALDTAHRSAGAAYGKTSRALEVRDVEWWVEHLAKTYPDLPLFLMGYSAVRVVSHFVVSVSQASLTRGSSGRRIGAGVSHAQYTVALSSNDRKVVRGHLQRTSSVSIASSIRLNNDGGDLGE